MFCLDWIILIAQVSSMNKDVSPYVYSKSNSQVFNMQYLFSEVELLAVGV